MKRLSSQRTSRARHVTGVYTNLSRLLSRTVGRESEMRRLDEAMRCGAPIVTVWGPGGVGKTRLVREWGLAHASSAGAGCGGVWFCDLSEAHSAREICEVVARVLEAPPAEVRTDSDLQDSLGLVLAGHANAVLILDNCEQCVAELVPLLLHWADCAMQVQFLATSREPLLVEGEQRFEVLPLSVPAPGEDLLSSPAAQLFLERGAALNLDRDALLREATTVAEIVRRLDGLPLAIELAASRLDVFSPTNLLGRLSNTLAALESRERGVASRHATMRATIDWSWEMLSDWERCALAQCSAFHGTFDVAAFESVVDLSGFEDAPGPEEALQRLRTRSLLRADEAMRFSLLSVVREYAEERLRQQGDYEALVHVRHATHYVTRAESELAGRAFAFPHPALDLDNVLAAFRRAPVDGIKLRIAVALEEYFLERGPLSSHLRMLDEALAEQAATGRFPSLRVRAVLARARARIGAGLSSGLGADLQEAVAAAERLGDDGLLGHALTVWANFERVAGDLDAARVLLLRAEEILRAHGDDHALALTLNMSAHVLLRLGRSDEAERMCREAARKFRGCGNLLMEGRVFGTLGTVLADMGRIGEAQRRLELAVDRLGEAGDMHNRAIYLGVLATLHRDLGDPARGLELMAESISALQACGARHGHAVALGWMGLLYHEQGNALEACHCYEEARDMLAEIGDCLDELQFLGPLASAYAGLGRHDDAACVLAEAQVRATRLGNAAVRCALELHAGQLEVARGGDYLATGAREAAEQSFASARRRLTEPGPASSEDVRFARRLLERALDGLSSSSPGREAETVRRVLTVAADGRWFRVERRDVVQLGSRRALRLILMELSRRAASSDRALLSLDEVIGVGWPGEKILPAAAAARAYVALNRLRAMGLRDMLERHEGGYVLSRDVDVTFDA